MTLVYYALVWKPLVELPIYLSALSFEMKNYLNNGEKSAL